MTGTGPVTMQHVVKPRTQDTHTMALPTGRHAALLSLRAKLNKAHVIAHDLKLNKVSERALMLFTEVDAELAKVRKAPKPQETDDEINEGDDAAE